MSYSAVGLLYNKKRFLIKKKRVKIKLSSIMQTGSSLVAEETLCLLLSRTKLLF